MGWKWMQMNAMHLSKINSYAGIDHWNNLVIRDSALVLM